MVRELTATPRTIHLLFEGTRIIKEEKTKLQHIWIVNRTQRFDFLEIWNHFPPFFLQFPQASNDLRYCCNSEIMHLLRHFGHILDFSHRLDVIIDELVDDYYDLRLRCRGPISFKTLSPTFPPSLKNTWSNLPEYNYALCQQWCLSRKWFLLTCKQTSQEGISALEHSNFGQWSWELRRRYAHISSQKRGIFPSCQLLITISMIKSVVNLDLRLF